MNTNSVPPKQWKKRNKNSKLTFNLWFKALSKTPDVLLHPDVKLYDKAHIKTLARNVSRLLADECQRGYDMK